MTINSEWVKILKENSASSFSSQLPQQANIKTVFIDGQIKLMKSSHVQTWEQFVRVQFISYIEQCFAQFHNDICVLAFDNYDYVPTAKGPTQRHRNKSTVSFLFDADDLPVNMPVDWGAAMRNRTFKTKVISFVISRVRKYFESKLYTKHKTLIIDFKPELSIIGHIPCTDYYESMREYCKTKKRGECDIKGFDWVGFGPTVMMSTDGDYIAIALSQLACQKLPHDVYIYRMKVNLKQAEKRTQTGNTKKEYEFIHIQNLASTLTARFPHINIADVITCIALSGCDFAMNLPLIGPSKLWNTLLKTHEPAMLTTINQLQFVIMQTYSVKFLKCTNKQQDYAVFLQNIKKQSNAQKQVQMLWNEDRIQAHCKNVLWTMQYWTKLCEVPDALQLDTNGVSKWGFVRIKNVVAFDG